MFKLFDKNICIYLTNQIETLGTRNVIGLKLPNGDQYCFKTSTISMIQHTQTPHSDVLVDRIYTIVKLNDSSEYMIPDDDEHVYDWIVGCMNTCQFVDK